MASSASASLASASEPAVPPAGLASSTARRSSSFSFRNAPLIALKVATFFRSASTSAAEGALASGSGAAPAMDTDPVPGE